MGAHRSAQAERGEVRRRQRERHCFSTVLWWLLACFSTLACRAFSALARFAAGSRTRSWWKGEVMVRVGGWGRRWGEEHVHGVTTVV